MILGSGLSQKLQGKTDTVAALQDRESLQRPVRRRDGGLPALSRLKRVTPCRTAVDRTLIQEILEVVEQAGIASAKLTGLGLKNEADAAAVEAMRLRMGQIQMQGRIVIGEGERDEAPMLYIGEEVGSGTGPGVDFAVDPCEGTNLCANSQRGSMAVLAASDRGGLFNAPDFYMKKLAAPPAAKGKVDIRKSATENIKILSECLGLPADELVIVVMDRARHKDLIKEIRATGARVQPISDGDVQAAIACGFSGTGTHCLMGIGAAPEGVISAAALRALGGHFQGQLVYDPAVAQTASMRPRSWPVARTLCLLPPASPTACSLTGSSLRKIAPAPARW